jgi:amino acid transporter
LALYSLSGSLAKLLEDDFSPWRSHCQQRETLWWSHFLWYVGLLRGSSENDSLFVAIQARLNQEIARQGLLPFGALLSSSKPFGTPLGGLVLHYIPSVIVICIPYKDIYSFILNVEGYPAQVFSLAISLGLIRMRWTRPDLKRPYRAFLPAVWFMVFLSCALLCSPFVTQQGEGWVAHLSRVSYALVGLSV